MEEKFKQREIKRAEKDLQKERLDRAVENYSFRPKVEGDFDRMTKETAAREIRKITQHDNADQVHLFSNHGFTIDGLMKDIRYKVSTALAEAGLQNSAYGQQLLKGLNNGASSVNNIIHWLLNLLNNNFKIIY